MAPIMVASAVQWYLARRVSGEETSKPLIWLIFALLAFLHKTVKPAGPADTQRARPLLSGSRC